MWSREYLKTRAKNVLRITYWYSFLVTFILGIVQGGFSGGFNSGIRFSSDNSFPLDISSIVIPVVIGIASIFFIVGIVFRVFVSNPFEVSATRYFIDAREKAELNNLTFSFKNKRYMNIVFVMFIKNLFVFLWTLLFIVPGIIKAYQYILVSYILADNPDMEYRDALLKSKEMTDGQKFEIFVLQLSFIGWYILGILACGIGVMFVQPYFYATLAELYVFVRDNETMELNEPEVIIE